MIRWFGIALVLHGALLISAQRLLPRAGHAVETAPPSTPLTTVEIEFFAEPVVRPAKTQSQKPHGRALRSHAPPSPSPLPTRKRTSKTRPPDVGHPSRVAAAKPDRSLGFRSEVSANDAPKVTQPARDMHDPNTATSTVTSDGRPLDIRIAASTLESLANASPGALVGSREPLSSPTKAHSAERGRSPWTSNRDGTLGDWC